MTGNTNTLKSGTIDALVALGFSLVWGIMNIVNLSHGAFIVVAMQNEKSQIQNRAAALRLIEEIVSEHGPVLFHQSGGCCDGSSPMCYPRDEFIIGDTDVLLGHIGGAPVYISAPQFEAWKHTDLIIDVNAPARGFLVLADQYYPGWRATVGAAAALIQGAQP